MSDYTLLVVDDNQLNRDSLSRILRRQGYKVETAENGQEALEQLHCQDFDLVLLDIMMPVMNGYEVLKHLKADPKLRRIPVIVVSANEEIESVVQCIELGAEDYLPKPFNRVLLQARITASLERKRLYDQEQHYLELVRRELDTGRQIQTDFLPPELPQMEGLELAACFKPAREVAGDFYDAFVLPGNRVVLVIADVCDKGVGAALFMALTRSLLRVLAQQAAARLQLLAFDPEQHFVLVRDKNLPEGLLLAAPTYEILNAVKLTNDYITLNHNRVDMFATLFFAVLELNTGKLSYINAGHEAPLHLGSKALKGQLKATGPAVGVMQGVNFAIRQVQLESGDSLLAYTDGVTEARNQAGQFFGEKQLIQVTEEFFSERNTSAGDLIQKLENLLKSYIAGGDPSDDITMLTTLYTLPVANQQAQGIG